MLCLINFFIFREVQCAGSHLGIEYIGKYYYYYYYIKMDIIKCKCVEIQRFFSVTITSAF